MLGREESIRYAEEAAVKLRNLYLEKYGDPDNPLHLDLVNLGGKIGGSIYEVFCNTQWKDFNVLEAQEGGGFIVRLNTFYMDSEIYKSSLRLAFVIGDCLLNFQDAKPGTVCRTYQETRHVTASSKPSYDYVVHFGWSLLLPADLFENTWWLYRCNASEVAKAFDVSCRTAQLRSQQLNLPIKPLESMEG